MPFEVDPAFRKGNKASRARASRRKAGRFAAIGGGVAAVLLLIAGVTWWILRPGPVGPTDTPQTAEIADSDGARVDDPLPEQVGLVQTDESAASGLARVASAFIDLPGDPMILRFDTGGGNSSVQVVAGPEALPSARVGLPAENRITVIRDALVVEEQRLVTTIPSSREDFAFFQAQRSQGLDPQDGATEVEGEVAAGTVVAVDGDAGSWGEALGDDAEDDMAVYVETTIENTTSVVVIQPEAQRSQLYDDTIVVVQTERSLSDVLISNGFPEAESTWATTGILRSGSEKVSEELLAALPPGSIVAVRTREGLAGLDEITHISLYSDEALIDTFARTGPTRYETSADPWFDDRLVEQSGRIQDDVRAQQDIRLLDALYSAAIRNDMPTSVVGEMIVVMSQLYDLDSFAAVGDEVTILRATNPGPQGEGPGQVLYVAINGPSGDMECYVTRDAASGNFGCFDFSGSGGIGGGLGNGLATPVNGTKTSDFGPRQHPILNQLRNHNGVDWAAPTGTPVVAALPGRIEVRGNGGGYGNVIYIDHGNGIQTRYAHLDRFGPPQQGDQVQQGQLIGYVGTTGRSTGPHLHFELHVNGTPVDPLSWRGLTGGGATGSAAVEALVNQIIRVESAGNANAANPLSSARGLGQFIESTWLRMMSDYRPDLVANLTREEVLNLRFNPELSREMVRNLARENEAFLRARGHVVTPGRLYLAHFLGPGGANTALRAGPNQTVLEVMGAGVVNANPFLRGKTIAWLWDWADRKMRGSGSGSGSAPPPVAVVPEEVQEYRNLIDGLLAALDPEDGPSDQGDN